MNKETPRLQYSRAVQAPVLPEDGGSKASLYELLETMIAGHAEMAAVVDTHGTFLLTNRQWDDGLRQRGTAMFKVGSSYPAALKAMIQGGDARIWPVFNAFSSIAAGKRRRSHLLYYGSGDFSGDYNVILSAVDIADQKFVLITVQDVTEVNALKREREELATGILEAQESERRRIARELHDSTSQYLVVLQMNLERLAIKAAAGTGELVDECTQIVREIQSEIRSLSFMAHPPSLIENGLAPAIEKLVAGFASRTDLKIDLQISDIGEAVPVVEAALYRLAQEALSNVHRHAQAKSAAVRLVGRSKCILLVVSDDGIGFDTRHAFTSEAMGVGIMGMKQRVRELNGRFGIRRMAKRTVLSVCLPRDGTDANSCRSGGH